jgi:DMSO reductase iron-sulfur subunit
MTVKMFEPDFEKIAAQRQSESIFPLRDNEPEYAKLSDESSEETNRYGNLISLTNLVEEAASLNINGVSEKGFNPNRNKQHAFHFTADNCIGCHACESACSEKNDLPAHLSFRSVGYVEGGTYPDYQRMNISMACNHCDDPVCLKGCPTGAYTKHAEYGAVIQDPDICFGCGYCTWVCPYNAPQLDPVKGQVEKCNMCVDRLEVGLKPACVSACLGNALNFGVVENTPENRQQIETQIPGFPDPAITQPNIRFQQTKSLPREMTRPDSAPIKYRRDDASGNYKPAVDKSSTTKSWNLARLSSRENPLVLFTLASQAAIGLFALLFFGDWGLSNTLYAGGIFLSAALAGIGLLISASHLGKPFRAYRGFNNLRHSPMAREGFAAALFMAFSGLHFLAVALQTYLPAFNPLAPISGWLAVPAAIATLYYMYRCYRIKARPFWNHWQTATSFTGSSLYLGAALLGLISIFAGTDKLQLISLVMLAGVSLEGLGFIAHARNMSGADHEGAVSHYVQTTTFGYTYRARNIGYAVIVASLSWSSLQMGSSGSDLSGLWLLTVGSLCLLALISRGLFYVLVVPTTMPGAFFWKNKGFEQHARDIGLADMPQVGVAPEGH